VPLLGSSGLSTTSAQHFMLGYPISALRAWCADFLVLDMGPDSHRFVASGGLCRFAMTAAPPELWFFFLTQHFVLGYPYSALRPDVRRLRMRVLRHAQQAF